MAHSCGCIGGAACSDTFTAALAAIERSNTCIPKMHKQSSHIGRSQPPCPSARGTGHTTETRTSCERSCWLAHSDVSARVSLKRSGQHELRHSLLGVRAGRRHCWMLGEKAMRPVNAETFDLARDLDALIALEDAHVEAAQADVEVQS